MRISDWSSDVCSSDLTLGHYAIAKGALNSLSKTLASELGRYGIRSNVIAPGFIITEMTQADPEVGAKIAAAVALKAPLGRAGTPDDLAGAAVYQIGRAHV